MHQWSVPCAAGRSSPWVVMAHALERASTGGRAPHFFAANPLDSRPPRTTLDVLPLLCYSLLVAAITSQCNAPRKVHPSVSARHPKLLAPWSKRPPRDSIVIIVIKAID
jgi:hypothetical protein